MKKNKFIISGIFFTIIATFLYGIPKKNDIRSLKQSATRPETGLPRASQFPRAISTAPLANQAHQQPLPRGRRFTQSPTIMGTVTPATPPMHRVDTNGKKIIDPTLKRTMPRRIPATNAYAPYQKLQPLAPTRFGKTVPSMGVQPKKIAPIDRELAPKKIPKNMRPFIINGKFSTQQAQKLTTQAKEVKASASVAQKISQKAGTLKAPMGGTTTKKFKPQAIKIGGKTSHVFWHGGKRHIVWFRNNVPYRLVFIDGTWVWRPWPRFWVLWPWWFDAFFAPSIVIDSDLTCQDCDYYYNCPHGFDCPAECEACYVDYFEYV